MLILRKEKDLKPISPSSTLRYWKKNKVNLKMSRRKERIKIKVEI